MNNGSATYANTGDLASLSSTCTQPAGTCADSSKILNLTQSYASATVAVLAIRIGPSGAIPDLIHMIKDRSEPTAGRIAAYDALLSVLGAPLSKIIPPGQDDAVDVDKLIDWPLIDSALSAFG